MEAACVSTLLKDETGGLDENRAMSMALLRRYGLFHRLEVGTQKLLQVGLKRALPRHAEDVPSGETNSRTTCPVGTWISCCDIALGGDAAQRSLHVRLVVLHRGDVVAQRRPRRKSKRQQHAGKQQADGFSVWKSKGSRSIHCMSFNGFAHELSQKSRRPWPGHLYVVP